MNTFIKISLSFLIISSFNFSLLSQCADSSNIYSFIYDGRTYEIIKENKTWIDAAQCAVERGGILAEINSLDENNAIFNELITNANIDPNNTIAPDGGNSSYVWIGGNDISSEGTWVWNGNNDTSSTHFWSGTFSNGNVVGGLFNNWGNEPDNWNNQDGLGLAIINWPLGPAGKWNDVDHTNTLYFVVEYGGNVGLENGQLDNQIKFYPNPFKDNVYLKNTNSSLDRLVITNMLGEVIKTFDDLSTSLHHIKFDLSDLSKGSYIVNGFVKNNRCFKQIIFK